MDGKAIARKRPLAALGVTARRAKGPPFRASLPSFRAKRGISFAALVLAAAVAVAQEGADATVTAKGAKAKVGEPAQVSLRFAVPAGSHISPDAPLALRFSGDEHVEIARPVLHYKDGAFDNGAGPEFRDQVTPLTAGAHDVTVDASYYVCTAELCNRHTKTLHLTVTAK